MGFPVHFPYDMGATDTIHEGDLAGTMGVCLNITGNYKDIHSEWATQRGEGWSPSMTLSSLLVQIQSLLIDIRVDQRLRQNLQSYTCQVDEDSVYTFNEPFPPITTAAPAAPPAAALAETRCYVSGRTDADDVLGYGLQVTGRSQMVSTPAEPLSWTAFKVDGVRLSAEKERFSLFWPVLPNDGSHPHPDTAHVLACCTAEASGALGCDQSQSAVILTTKLITGIVVDMMKGEKPGSWLVCKTHKTGVHYCVRPVGPVAH